MNSQLNDSKKRWIEVFYSPLRARTTIIRRTGRKMRRKRRRRRDEKKKKKKRFWQFVGSRGIKCLEGRWFEFPVV